jgi:hypothetical protein
MSCGSTTCTPTNFDLPVSKPLDGFEWLRLRLLALLASCDRCHQRQQLLGLDDHLLADIGITREQATDEARKSFWIRATLLDIYR